MSQAISQADCIPTHYKLDGYGYGRIKYLGRSVKHHRFVYCQANGLFLDDIEGLIVRHKCDNRSCVNPAHLILGTHMDNMIDMSERGRRPSRAGEGNGRARLTKEQVHEIRSSYTGKRGEIAAFGRAYEVSPCTILKVIRNQSWSPSP